MGKFLLRWFINAVALYVAVLIVPGVNLENPSWLSIIWLALIFGLLNALLGPLLKMLTCPLILLTLGLFTLVINAILLAVSAWVGTQFGVGLIFADPWWWHLFLASLVVTVVSVVLSLFLHGDRRRKNRR